MAKYIENRGLRKLLTKRLLWIIPVMAVGLVIYARWIEPGWIQVTQHTIYVHGLPKSLDGITIVQLSDLHRGRRVNDSLIEQSVKIAQSESPDIVVLTGDYVSSGEGNAEPCARMLGQLKPRMGTYAVLGNHDYWYGELEVIRAMRSQGIVVLRNTNRQVAPGLYIIGIEDIWAGYPDVKKSWSGVDPNAAQIVLAHSPRAVKLFSSHRCLALTGHTHGGEFKIPLIPRSKLPGLRGWEYIQGWYKTGNTDLYVNRGIGLVNPAKIRFLSRPEISVFHLRSVDTQ